MSNLRPYYNPTTFRSPINGYNDLGLATTLHQAGNSASTHAPSSSNNGGNFVYLDVNFSETGDTITGLGLSMFRLYSRVFISQPWEVTRLLMQVGDWSHLENDTFVIDPSNGQASDSSDEDDEMDYFTAVTGENLRPRRERRPHPNSSSNNNQITTNSISNNNDPSYPEHIKPASMHFFDIIQSIYSKDGAPGMWRGLNTTFIMKAFGSTVEAWLTGFISSIAGIPDPHFVEVLHSPNPLVSLTTAVCAGVLTSIVLAPIDLIRSRMLVTTYQSADKHPRSIRTSLWQVDSLISSWSILVPTVLHSGLATLIRKSSPYLLYTRLGVDRFNSPSFYSMLMLLSALFEQVVKTPLETLVRRSHIASLNLDKPSLLVKPAEYRGVAGTTWAVLSGEIGIHTLYRGFQVSVVGTLAEWGFSAIQSSEQGKERF